MTEVRDRLALSHDFSDLDTAERLAKELAPWFGVAKVGLELYSAAGPEAIARMRALDFCWQAYGDSVAAIVRRASPNVTSSNYELPAGCAPSVGEPFGCFVSTEAVPSSMSFVLMLISVSI